MGVEIERKFLVQNELWREGARCVSCEQGYIGFGPPVSVRIRIMEEKATLNIKQAVTAVERAEYEYPLPIDDARELLETSCVGSPVRKIRHYVAYGGHTWEVDEFLDDNAGLVVAEIELESVDESFVRPPWLGLEVSEDPRYLNANLARTPFSGW
jgi:adenylate cyclase